MSAVSLSSQTGTIAGREDVATVATTLEQVEALRPVWNSLPVVDVDSDIDYFMTVVKHAAQVVRPHVVHIRRDDGSSLIAVARLENLPVAFRFGYRILGRATLRAVVVTFDGILGARNRQDEALAMKHLTHAFKSGEADLLLMRNVDLESTLYREATASGGVMRRAHAQPTAPRWIACMADSLERFLETRSMKTRETLRRHDRRLNDKFGSRLQLQRWTDPQDMPRICRDMETVAAKSYQRGLGVGYLGDPMQRGLIELGLKRGWHRTWMLAIDDRPVAFWTGLAYAGTFFAGTPGFDPEYGKYSVGRLTMLRMIEDLCADPDIKCLDFGHGDAEYKSAYAQCIRMESDVMLAARRPWPMLVVLAVSALALVNKQARRFAENTELGRRLKAGWRNGRARST